MEFIYLSKYFTSLLFSHNDLGNVIYNGTIGNGLESGVTQGPLVNEKAVKRYGIHILK